MTVSQDATSGWYCPASAAEWTELLAGSDIGNPTSLWLCQEAAGNLADSIGANVLTKFNVPGYAQAVSGWTRKAVTCGQSADAFYNQTLGDIGANSHLMFAYVAADATPTVAKKVMWLGTGGSNIRYAQITTAPVYSLWGDAPQATGTGASNPGTTVHPVLLQVDRTNNAVIVQTDQEIISPVYSAPGAAGAYMGIGPDSIGSASPTVYYLYVACWRGVSSELTSSQRATLLSRLENGPTSSTVLSRNRLVNGGGMGPMTKGSLVNE